MGEGRKREVLDQPAHGRFGVTTTAPSFMTKTGWAVAVMSTVGSPGRADDVGELADFEGADRLAQAEQLGVDGGRGP